MNMQVKYPEIDRSDLEPRFSKRDRNDSIDLFWDEGVLNDGRPYRAEMWAGYQMTHLSFFISTTGLENATKQELKDYLISKGLVEFDDKEYNSCGFDGINLKARRIKDPYENEFWELTTIIGDEDGTYVKSYVRMENY